MGKRSIPESQKEDLEETKRIMERLVKMPHKPHKPVTPNKESTKGKKVREGKGRPA
jgi:hypothetical protein